MPDVTLWKHKTKKTKRKKERKGKFEALGKRDNNGGNHQKVDLISVQCCLLE